ncbi:MAG: phage protease [Methylotenera sp.]|nr:phage protease [Methylotenera sp.]
MAQNLHISAMSFSIGTNGLISNEAHLLPAGEFKPADGRKLPFDSIKLTADIASNVIALVAARKNDTLIDYEHQSLYAKENGKPVIAAGWFHEMEFRADGLWAINIGWTETAKLRIKEKEYRYISAVCLCDADTGAVVDIISVALTNTPAIDGLQSLAALSRLNHPLPHQNLQIGDLTMSGTEVTALTTERDGLKTQVMALTTERDTLKADVVALSAERDNAITKLKDFETKQAEVALAAEEKAHSDLLATALSDGRLAPAQKAWAEKQPLVALTEYLEATAPLVGDDKQSTDQKNNANHGLNTEELAMCSQMNVSPEVFAATKQQEAERKAKAGG